MPGVTHEKTIITDSHDWRKIFHEVGSHDAAATLYQAEVIKAVGEELLAVLKGLKEIKVNVNLTINVNDGKNNA